MYFDPPNLKSILTPQTLSLTSSPDARMQKL